MCGTFEVRVASIPNGNVYLATTAPSSASPAKATALSASPISRSQPSQSGTAAGQGGSAAGFQTHETRPNLPRISKLEYPSMEAVPLKRMRSTIASKLYLSFGLMAVLLVGSAAFTLHDTNQSRVNYEGWVKTLGALSCLPKPKVLCDDSATAFRSSWWEIPQPGRRYWTRSPNGTSRSKMPSMSTPASTFPRRREGLGRHCARTS